LISDGTSLFGKFHASSVCLGKSNVQVMINTEHWCSWTKINRNAPRRKHTPFKTYREIIALLTIHAIRTQRGQNVYFWMLKRVLHVETA